MSVSTDEFESISPLILNYVQQGKILENKVVEIESKVNESTNLLLSYKERHLLLSKAQSVIQNLAEQLADNHIQRVQELVSYALQTVFYDRSYSFKIEVSDRGSAKQADLFLVEDINGDTLQSPLRDSVGGGVLAIIGFTLQVFYIQYLGATRTLFLDESFSQLSSRYIEGLITFIKVLCEENHFKVILISHDPRIIDFADKTLHVSMGVVTT